MKLHLPKILCMAVMAVSCAGGATLTDSNIKKVADGTRVLDVGSSSLITMHEWNGDITVGNYGESKGTVDAIGYVSSNELLPSSSLNGSTNTNRINVKGNVTLQGNGKIILGGRRSSSSTYGGIKANSITVGHVGEESDSPTFFASMTEIDTLTINSGTVTLGAGSDCYTGNSLLTEKSRKMAQVKTELNVHGGNVVFGQEYDKANHYQSALGYYDTDAYQDYIVHGATINQTNGTLNFVGNTLVANGLEINQDGGEMIFSDPMAFEASKQKKGSTPVTETDNTIRQNGTADTKLVINGMKDASNEPPTTMVTNFIQQGAGTIELKGDVNYTTDGVNTITQEGNSTTGKFNVQANCSSVKFSLQQKATGATINVLGKMNIVDSSIHGTLHVGHDATLNVQGELTVADTATLNFGVNSTTDAAAMNIATTNGGSIVALGAAVSLTLTEALTTELDTYFTSEYVGDKTWTFNLISNFDANQLDNLTKGDIFTTPAAVATLATDDIAYEVRDWSLSVTDDKVLQATVTWQAVKAGEQIPEPATATLGLLALAGLAARRRRASR